MPIQDWEIFADESEYSRSSFKYVNLKNLMSYERNKNSQSWPGHRNYWGCPASINPSGRLS